MKKIILTLFISLSLIMVANATSWGGSVTDTLPKRVINGLEVTPIRQTYESGEIFWKLRAVDFEKKLQRFNSKYPGAIEHTTTSREMFDAIYNWQDTIWKTVVPEDIKALKGIDIMLFVDKKGHVFTADFSMTNEVFQKLNTLPRNTLKNLYHSLIKGKCKEINEVEFCHLDKDNEFDRSTLWYVCGSGGIGKEYITTKLSWQVYDTYGTSNLYKYFEMEEKKYQKK